MRRLVALLCLTVLTASIVDAQELPRLRIRTRAVESIPIPGDGGGGGTPAAITLSELLVSRNTTDAHETWVSTDANFAEGAGATQFACATGALCLYFVQSTDSDAAGPSIPTSVTHTGQTLTFIGSVMEGTPQLRTNLYVSVGAGAAAAAITAVFSGDAQNGVMFNVLQAENVDTSVGTLGLLSVNSLAQTNVGSLLASSGTRVQTLSLSSRSDGSAVIAHFAVGQSCTIAAEQGFTAGTANNYSGPNVNSLTLRVIGGSDVDPSMTVSACNQNSIDWTGIVVELAPSAGADTDDPFITVESPNRTGLDSVTVAAGYDLSGLMGDNVAVDSVTYECDNCTVEPAAVYASDGTWSITNATLGCSVAPGTVNLFTVTVEDTSTNTASDTHRVTCISPDSVDPLISVTSHPPTNSVGVGSILVSGPVSDETALHASVPVAASCPVCASVGTVVVSGGIWSVSITPTASANPGTANTLTLTAQDAAGNTADAVVVFTAVSADSTDPTSTITCGSGDGVACTISTTGFPRTVSGVAADTGGSGLASVIATSSTCTLGALTGLTTWSVPVLSCSGVGATSGAVTANTITVTITDGEGNDVVKTITLNVYKALRIVTASCGQGEVGEAFSCTITAEGGTGNYTYTEPDGILASDAQCDGLSFADAGSTATITGTPTANGLCGDPDRVRVHLDDTATTFDQDLVISIAASGQVEGPHDFFTTLQGFGTAVSHAKCAQDTKGCGLRNQTQINGLQPDPDLADPWWEFDFAGDTNLTHRQDAVKLVFPPLRRYQECRGYPAISGEEGTNKIWGWYIATGTPGTVIPAGTMLRNATTGYTYRQLNAVTIPASGVTAKLRLDAFSPGTYLNEIPRNTLLEYVTPISGVNNTPKIGSAASDAVLVRCSHSVPIKKQLKLPLNYDTGTILVTWDFYFTPDFRNNVISGQGSVADPGTFSSIKAFKFQFSDRPNDETGGGWTLFIGTRETDRHTPTEVGDYYTAGGLGSKVNGSYTQGRSSAGDDYGPSGLGAQPSRSYPIFTGKWTRYWVEIKLQQPGSAFTEWAALVCRPGQANNPCTGAGGAEIGTNHDSADGLWMMRTIWIADEDRDPVAVEYRVPVASPGPYVTRFDFEFNTSTPASSAVPGPWDGYGRNIMVLRNYSIAGSCQSGSCDAVLFKRPVR